MSEHDRSNSANVGEERYAVRREEWDGCAERLANGDGQPGQDLPQYYLPCAE